VSTLNDSVKVSFLFLDSLLQEIFLQFKMEHYDKGRTVEDRLTTANIPIVALPEHFGWLLVGGHTKISKIVEPALGILRDEEAIVLAGSGASTAKVMSLCEIIKKEKRDLYTILKRGHRKIQEFWDPLTEGLDPLVVIREIQTLHILLSANKIDTTESEEEPIAKKRSRVRNSPKKKPQNPKEGFKNARDLGLLQRKKT